jgi:hypothetical protein
MAFIWAIAALVLPLVAAGVVVAGTAARLGFRVMACLVGLTVGVLVLTVWMLQAVLTEHPHAQRRKASNSSRKASGVSSGGR